MTNTAALHKAEGTYKLAEIVALEAEQDAQVTRRLSEWNEQYGTMAEALTLRVLANSQDKRARDLEDGASMAYSYWALLADNL
jgi:hypothetical protein